MPETDPFAELPPESDRSDLTPGSRSARSVTAMPVPEPSASNERDGSESTPETDPAPAPGAGPESPESPADGEVGGPESVADDEVVDPEIVVEPVRPDSVTIRELGTSGSSQAGSRRRRRSPLVWLFGLVFIAAFGWLISRCGGGADQVEAVPVTVVPPDLAKTSVVLETDLALDARAAVAGAGYESVQVTGEDGSIVLAGSVATDLDIEQAEQVARSVTGVEEVDNQLVAEAANTSVETALTRALAGGGFDRVEVVVSGGQATVSGAVETEADRDAVTALVGAVDGVDSVELDLLVAPRSAGNTPEAIALLADLEALFEAEPILFEPAAASITEGSRQTLDRAVSLITESDLVLEVGGHTDSSGNARTNQLLSEKRAQAVKAYLVAKGVDPDRLDAVGYGPNEPIADNATEEGRAANRRIVFRVIEP